MKKLPAISVLMPVYNAEKYLKQSIESVLNQTFTDFELIMINDGSTDNSLKILESYMLQDSRCIVHNQENKGLVATLNEGINIAKADIIFRMDNDDICMPQRFEKQMEYLNSHPECVALGTSILLIDPDGFPINTWLYEQSHNKIDALNLSGAAGSHICHPSVALRKSVLLSIGGYRQEYEWAEDYDLFLRLAEVGKLANLQEVLLKYRQHAASIGYAKRKQQLTVSLKVLEDVHERRQLRFDSKKAVFLKSINDYVAPSKHDIHLKWGWWALSERNYQTSVRNAIKAIFQKPFNMNGFKLLACVARDYISKR